MFGFGVDKEIRLEEQLKELVEQYGISNVKKTVAKIEANPPATKQQNFTAPKEAPEAEKIAAVQPAVTVDMKSDANYQAQIEAEKMKSEKPEPNLPPNAKNLNEFIESASQLQKDKIRDYVLAKVKEFVDGARLVEVGDYKKIDQSFAMDLTKKELFGEITSPEEDWLDYNITALKKDIKKRLRPLGYDFLDLEFEVGKTFDKNRHNCVGRETVDSPTKDNRVVRVVNEGLIIDKVLHINANVIVGQYKT